MKTTFFLMISFLLLSSVRAELFSKEDYDPELFQQPRFKETIVINGIPIRFYLPKETLELDIPWEVLREDTLKALPQSPPRPFKHIKTELESLYEKVVQSFRVLYDKEIEKQGFITEEQKDSIEALEKYENLLGELIEQKLRKSHPQLQKLFNIKHGLEHLLIFFPDEP